jgi:hypothetical protein
MAPPDEGPPHGLPRPWCSSPWSGKLSRHALGALVEIGPHGPNYGCRRKRGQGIAVAAETLSLFRSEVGADQLRSDMPSFRLHLQHQPNARIVELVLAHRMIFPLPISTNSSRGSGGFPSSAKRAVVSSSDTPHRYSIAIYSAMLYTVIAIRSGHTRPKPGSQSHGSSPPPRRRPSGQLLTPLRSQDRRAAATQPRRLCLPEHVERPGRS